MAYSIRNFAISFLIAAVVFGVIAFFGVRVAERAFEKDKKTDPGASDTDVDADDDTDTDDDPDNPIQGRSFSFVLIGSDYQDNTFTDYEIDPTIETLYSPRLKCADTVIFVRYRVESKELIICPIPTSAKVDVKGVSMTLGEAYHYEGAEFVAHKVASLVGITVDYYASTTMQGLSDIIDYIGGIKYYVPCDMVYEDPDQALKINLSAGYQTLDGEKAIKMLRYNGYGDNTSRTRLAADFGAALLSKMSTYTNMQKYQTLFSKLSTYVDTNFTLSALTENCDLIFSYSYLSTANVTYPGNYVDDGFVPDITSAHEAFAAYK